MLRPVLSPGASRLRDWALFAAAASVPAICVGALGLRALASEAGGARREVAPGLSTTSALLSRALDQQSDRAAAALAALPMEGPPRRSRRRPSSPAPRRRSSGARPHRAAARRASRLAGTAARGATRRRASFDVSGYPRNQHGNTSD
ncbi:hypothetical protein WME90_37090 [Sorangium sp. So ce375]|uniref:hypothetical protein n=1 Tax=Sorangium sp. So ce375 TaxID=3133306 RepID=UPI003F5C6EB1